MPVRTCLGCRAKREKHELLRFVARNGTLTPDPRMVLPGRGAYLCPVRSCFEGAYKRKGVFAHALRERGLVVPDIDELWQSATDRLRHTEA